jgi:hypothetical protein
MFEFKYLDEWLEEIRNERIDYLNEFKSFYNDFKSKKFEASKNGDYVEIKGEKFFKIVSKDKEYLFPLSVFSTSKNDIERYFLDNGFLFNKNDIKIVTLYNINKEVDKEIKYTKKFVISKVIKILEGNDDTIYKIDYIDSNLFYIENESNNMKASVTRIYAGGYNIQRFHTRILVKKLKN